MSEPWGRDDAGAWQNPRPVWTLAAFLFAAIGALCFANIQIVANYHVATRRAVRLRRR
jgi:hypothetical protein